MAKKSPAEKVERVYEENRKLKAQVKNLQDENRKLKSKNRTLDRAWKKTESYLEVVTEGRSVLEIVKDVAAGKKLGKLESSCSKCKSTKVSILPYKNFRLVVCSERNCKFKEKIDGTEAEQE